MKDEERRTSVKHLRPSPAFLNLSLDGPPVVSHHKREVGQILPNVTRVYRDSAPASCLFVTPLQRGLVLVAGKSGQEPLGKGARSR